MKTKRVSVRTILIVGAVISAFIGGALVAKATPGGPTKSSLSFAGTIKKAGVGVPGSHTLGFIFKKANVAQCTPTIQVTSDSGGAFATEIPINGCPTDLFDGSDIVFDVTVDGESVAQNQAVGPVPYAKYSDLASRALSADHVAASECPGGYVRDSSVTNMVLCKKGSDEVVKVGSEATVFWIDRYEATVWSQADGTGSQYGLAPVDYPSTFPENGQGSNGALLYAVSKSGVAPSAFMSWFQANRACRASGKRLPTGDEWFAAATGTPDPGASSGAGGQCVTSASGKRATGLGTNCQSVWGAEDMVGNLWEWTTEPYAGLGTSGAVTTWPSGTYGNDMNINISSSAWIGGAYMVAGLPANAMRGGAWDNGSGAGVFALSLANSPSFYLKSIGFRCMIPR